MFHGEAVSIIIVEIRNMDHAMSVEIMHYQWRSCNIGGTDPGLGAIGDPQCTVLPWLHRDMIMTLKVQFSRKSAR